MPVPVPPRTEPAADLRVARLIADGELPFPADLPAADAAALAAEVRRLRRGRLVRHVARAIAEDLLRDAGP